MECNNWDYCIQRKLYGCEVCETYKVIKSINNLQTSIDNHEMNNPYVFINKKYKNIIYKIDFKKVPWRITNGLPNDICACLVDRKLFDFSKFKEYLEE